MTSIGDTARIRPAKDVFEDTKMKAFEVWTRALKTAQARGGAPINSALGAKGMQFRGSMSEMIHQSFPSSRNYAPDDWNNFSRGITSHLKATGNAVCLAAPPSPIVWFVSLEWNDSAQPGREPTAREKAERKITPHEAGEDRTPGEVQYRMVAPGGNGTTSAPAETDKPAPAVPADPAPSRDEAYNALAKQINDTVRQWPEPSAMPEIAGATGLDIGQVARTLNRMIKERVIHARTETRDERTARASGVITSSRRARLVWHCTPVPIRTLPEFVSGTAPTHGYAALELAAENREALQATQYEKMDELMLDMLIAEGGRFRLWSVIMNKLDHEKAPFTGEGAVRASFRRLEVEGIVAISDSVETKRGVVVQLADYVAPPTPETNNPVDRIVLKVLEASKIAMCAQDIADVTGYSRGRVGDTLRLFPEYVRRVGVRGHHHLYAWNGPYVRKESAPIPTQETHMTTTAPLVAPPAPPLTATPTPRDAMLDALATLANGLNAPIVAPARVAELEAEVADLRAKLARSNAALRAATE